MFAMTFWTVTTRIDGPIDVTLLHSEKEAIDMAFENILDPSYDYDGPLTVEAINAFMISQQDDIGYYELVITKHEINV